MLDAEDTHPMSSGPERPTVVVLVEVVTVEGVGAQPLLEVAVYADQGEAEAEALRRYDLDESSRRPFLTADEQEHGRERFLHRLRRGRPSPVAINRTVRMRREVVR